MTLYSISEAFGEWGGGGGSGEGVCFFLMYQIVAISRLNFRSLCTSKKQAAGSEGVMGVVGTSRFSNAPKQPQLSRLSRMQW